MLPQETIDTLRTQVNVSLDNYGIDCDLWIPKNLTDVEPLDALTVAADYEFDHYLSKVWIDWSPNIYRLRKLGFAAEEAVPILARFGTKATNDDSKEADVDVLIHTCVKISPQFIPANYQGVERFEVVDTIIEKQHDAIIVQQYRLAPWRHGYVPV